MSPWFELSAETSDARFVSDAASSAPEMLCESRIMERLEIGSIVKRKWLSRVYDYINIQPKAV